MSKSYLASLAYGRDMLRESVNKTDHCVITNPPWKAHRNKNCAKPKRAPKAPSYKPNNAVIAPPLLYNIRAEHYLQGRPSKAPAEYWLHFMEPPQTKIRLGHDVLYFVQKLLLR